MKTIPFLAVFPLAFCTIGMHADSSYQETVQMTGGAMVNTLRSTPLLGRMMKNALAPVVTTTMVHGNQKAVISKTAMDITDLDRETVTHVDVEKKTCSVTTIAQMRQACKNMSEQMDKNATQARAQVQTPAEQPKSDVKMTFDVAVKNTGATRTIEGMEAQEQVLTMTAHATDASASASTQSPQSAAFMVTNHAWIVPDPPEIKEAHDFDIRMAKQLAEGVDTTAFADAFKKSGVSMTMFNQQPGSIEAMKQMEAEMAKVKGTRILEVMQMGAAGDGIATTSTAAAGPTPAPSNGSLAGQVATDTAVQTGAAESSRLGVFGSALGSSALGAWHRKKAAPEPVAAETTPAAGATAAASSSGTTNSAVLTEMTMQKSNFSTQAIPASSFEVPAGFTKIDSDYGRMNKPAAR